jgi:hypothetical protein
VETATGAVDAADAATEPAAETAAEAAEQAVTESLPAPEAQAAEQAPEALTVEGFDMEAARGLIEGAGLGAMQENLLVQGLKAAQDNPEMLKAALESAREALGY